MTLQLEESTDVQSQRCVPLAAGPVEIALLTGGGDKPYAFGLTMALLSKGVHIDFIGSDELDCPDFHIDPRLRFLNLRGSQRENVSFAVKVHRIVACYVRLVRYALSARPTIFHILWNNRFLTFDRTLLMLYYKFLGKKIVFTAHNVNAAKRDSKDTLLNRITLRIQYLLCNHIFVHTQKMKAELLADFGVCEENVSVIPFGINNAVPHTDLTVGEARERLGIQEDKRTILFFGRIGPYKGLEFLAAAYRQIAAKSLDYRLMIVGSPKKGAEKYLLDIQKALSTEIARGLVFQQIAFIPDEDTELYFKAADVVVLPYTEASQSGVLFLAYSFGLPVIATDVGSFAQDVTAGRTGMLCAPADANELARGIQSFFASDLYTRRGERRQEIQQYANSHNSWDAVKEITVKKYMELQGEKL